MTRTRNAVLNIIANVGYYLLTILLGILNRKAVVEFLGIEYQGINGLFGSVITMLSIAELGLGTAVISSLYAPVKAENHQLIRSMMRFYKKAYFIIAAVILGVGILLIPALPWLIKDYASHGIPYSLAVVYIWFLLDSAASYLAAHRRSLIIADQRNYMLMAADAVYLVLMKTCQILLLWKTRNFMYFLAAMLIFRLGDTALIWLMTEYRYPYLRESRQEVKNADSNESLDSKDTAQDIQELPAEIRQEVETKVKGAFFHKIGSFVVMGTDNILISHFLGLVVTGIYSNYSLVINAIHNICNKMISAVTASIGHLLLEQDQERTVEVYREMQMANLFVTNCAATGIYCATTPLISWIFGEQYTLDQRTLFVLAVNFGLQGLRNVFMSYKEAAGILYEDRMVPLMESIINIAASLVFLKFFGLVGIFMGTIVSTLVLYVYTYPVLIYKGVLRLKISTYIREMLWMLGSLLCCLLAGGLICRRISIEAGMKDVIFAAIIAAVSSFVLTYTGYAMWKPEMKALKNRIDNVVDAAGAGFEHWKKAHPQLSSVLLALLIGFCYLVLIPPTRFDYIDIINRYDTYVRVLVVGGICICYIFFTWKDEKLDPFLTGFILYASTLVMSSLAMHSDVKVAVWGSGIVPASIIMLTHMCMTKEQKLTINVLYYMYAALVFINFIDVIRHADLFKAIEEDLVSANNYSVILLGNRNRYINYYFLFLISGYYGVKKELLKERWSYPVLFTLCLICSFWAHSMNTIVGLILWGILCIIAQWKKAERLFNPYAAIILIFIGFLMLQIYDPEKSNLISSLVEKTGKLPSFSGRTEVWRKARAVVRQSLWIGQGFPYHYRHMIGVEHCHNVILTILFERGLAGLFCFILMVLGIGHFIMRFGDRITRTLLTVSLLCILLMNLFESYKITFLVLYAALLVYALPINQRMIKEEKSYE